MPYVVKNKSGQYLRSRGKWTQYLGEALLFPNGHSVPLHLETAMDRDGAGEWEIVRLPSTQGSR